MNLDGHWERSVGTGWMIGFGNIGAIVATFAFTKADAPAYHKGYSILLGGVCIVIAAAAIYGVLIWQEKRMVGKMERADRGEDDGELVRAGGAAGRKTYYL